MNKRIPEIISNRIFSDERGEFVKLFNGAEMPDFNIVQSNFVRNQKKGTFRGFHIQNEPLNESKLFMVLNGSIQLACFNYRDKNLKNRKVFSYDLNETSTGVRVPKGFATGYFVKEDNTSVLYFSDEEYAPECELGIRWDDPVLEKFLEKNPDFVSKKDQLWPNLTY